MLKAIARENGIQNYERMSKTKLVQVLQQLDIILDNLRVTELKSLARVRAIRGYHKMRKEELIEALNASIPEVEVPIPGVTKPPGKLSFTSLKRLVKKAGESVQTELNKFTDWVLELQIPEHLKKRTTQKVNKLKKKVEGLFNDVTRFKPEEHETAFNEFLETYRVGGRKGYDPENFFMELHLES